jgi:hypothetical protein
LVLTRKAGAMLVRALGLSRGFWRGRFLVVGLGGRGASGRVGRSLLLEFQVARRRAWRWSGELRVGTGVYGAGFGFAVVEPEVVASFRNVGKKVFGAATGSQEQSAGRCPAGELRVGT